MVRDIIRGILSEHQSKPLTKKRIEELVARLTAAVQMVRGADKVEVSPEAELEVVKAPQAEKSGVTTVESPKGNKAIISAPPEAEKPKKKKETIAVVAVPIGAMGQGSYEGKRVPEDVGAFAIKSNDR